MRTDYLRASTTYLPGGRCGLCAGKGCATSWCYGIIREGADTDTAPAPLARESDTMVVSGIVLPPSFPRLGVMVDQAVQGVRRPARGACAPGRQ
eukprot:scaffold80948_cov36-Tisochrysis_lutea.AAC.1